MPRGATHAPSCGRRTHVPAAALPPNRFYAQLLKTSNSYDALFGGAANGTRQERAARHGATSSKLYTDLGVAAPLEAAPGATDAHPMVVSASDDAATRLIDQAKHSIVREWIARVDTVWGRYGVPPDGYGLSQSDGFPAGLQNLGAENGL